MQVIKHRSQSSQKRPHADAWKGIPGYFDENDVAVIRALTADKEVLEIGTMYGRSTLAIASTAKGVLSIDNYTGDAMVDGRDPAAVKAIIEANDGDNISLYRGDWRDFFGQTYLIGEWIKIAEVLFYDAAHTPEDGAYEKDFLERMDGCWKTIVLHDYIPGNPAFRHVVEAIDAFEARTGRKRLGPVPHSSLVWFE